MIPPDEPGRPHHSERSADQEAGFTLIEVIAVLVIAALVVSAIAFRTTTSGGNAEVRAAAASIAAGLRRSRGHAIKNGREVAAQIDTARSRISWGTGQPALSLDRGLGLSVTAVSSETQGRVAAIRFFPNGSSTGGRLQLTSSNARYDIAVNWLTGRVSVERPE